MPSRRLLGVTLGALLVAAPAAALRALCVGRACDRPGPVRAEAPFCSLPRDVRDLLAAGFRDGRGPHVMAATGSTGVVGATRVERAPWPSEEPGDAGRVPLIFAGGGVDGSANVPAGTTLDAVAPTIAEGLALRRPHPTVRSGEAVAGVAAAPPPALVVLVVWKGVGSADLEASAGGWPVLRSLLRDGAGTLDARVGSLPLDPAAALTTIGTGGLPRDHGITGTLVRGEDGEVVEAFGGNAPFSVIAALGDDLDEVLRQEPRIGLVAHDTTDMGVVGGNWYVEGDRDDLEIAATPGSASRAAERLLASGYGDDGVPDLLAITLEGPIAAMDRALGRITRVAGEDALVAMTATGSAAGSGELDGGEVERRLSDRLGADVVEATAVGGVFVDQDALAAGGLTDDRVIAALRSLRAPDGHPLFADVFPQVAVSFARYCR